METHLLKDALLVNEETISSADLLIKNGRIERIDSNIDVPFKVHEHKLKGKHIFPGIIDDQVHFREPGLTHKATIGSESRAGIAGGLTSFMEMPNTKPGALSLELLEDKYVIASKTAAANYSFYLGASPYNLEELKKVNPGSICGIKIFMGSSTGDLLVNDPDVLEKIFCACRDTLIATHCEDDPRIALRLAEQKKIYGENIPAELHPVIRDAEACLLSSSMAIATARKCNARLHVLHLTTAIETDLFENKTPLEEKRITSEACVHHLWFTDRDYAEQKHLIKCNPAIKTQADRDAVFQALKDGRIDVVATDHAPHTWDEKQQPYTSAPAGLPLLQHSLPIMLEFYHQGKVTLEEIARWMCHHPARLFRIKERGFLREGYKADLAVVDLHQPFTVKDSRPGQSGESNVYHQCGWSPFNGHTFPASVVQTFLNGNLVWNHGQFIAASQGERLEFYHHE